jgi:molybdopterin-containing oxidoreductase family membrane subunit
MSAQPHPAPSATALDELPLIIGQHTDAELSSSLLRYIGQRPGLGWWVLMSTGLGLTGLFVVSIYLTIARGIGMWGNNIPVAWAYAITNFVWWIGIGHAGTLISAILYLFQQRWRNAINRVAEAMTLFAVMCAGLMPLLHLGRPWYFYWLIPYPPTMRVWPQFRSSLTWDVAAVSTYFTVSLLFWYLGLLPDLASARDSARTPWAKRIYGVFAWGWRGSARHWHHWKSAYLLLAGLATPLVVSVHTIVSFDFAISGLPGWHSTIFPPYFVAGAIFSGFALVLTLLLPARKALHLEHVITANHLDVMNRVMLVAGLVVAYGYIQEHFFAWYSGDRFEEAFYRFLRSSPLFWLVVFCNVAVPQTLWLKAVRRNFGLTWLISLAIQIGMWTERFTIVALPLTHDFLPSSWRSYRPTWVDWGILSGSIGFFMVAFLLFMKLVPSIPIYETKELQEDLEREARANQQWARQQQGAAP